MNVKRSTIILLCFLTCVLRPCFAAKAHVDIIRNIFKDYTKKESLTIDDPINDMPTNTKLIKVFKGDKTIGFVRQVTTSTGCNDGCLPVIFDLYYDASGEFLKLLSTPGLTKKYHKPFTPNDYIQLEMIVLYTKYI